MPDAVSGEGHRYSIRPELVKSEKYAVTTKRCFTGRSQRRTATWLDWFQDGTARLLLQNGMTGSPSVAGSSAFLQVRSHNVIKRPQVALQRVYEF